MKRQGHEISFLTQKPSNFDKTVFGRHYGDMGFHFVKAPESSAFLDFSASGGLVSTFNWTYSLAVAARFKDLYSEIQPDLVIMPEYGAEGLFLLWQARMGTYKQTRFVMTINGMFYNVIKTYEGGIDPTTPSVLEDPQNRITCAMEDLCVLLAKEIATPSSTAWAEIKQRININKKALFIPNYLDKELFDTHQPESNQTRKENMILFIGRLDRHKGADIMLQAYFQLAAKMTVKPVQLVMIGRDSFWKEHACSFLEYWEKRIPRTARPNITFLGQTDHNQVIAYLKDATVCVFPSRWEVFGIVCLEAMYYGCPVLVSKGTGLEDVIGAAFSDYIFDLSNSPDALAAKIDSVLNSPAELGNLGPRLRQRAEELICMSESRWLELIEDNSSHKREDVNISLPKVYENSFQIFNALSEVILHLGSDFTKVKQHFRLDDNQIRDILIQ